jgi:sugar phosphate isomerase/epimerase
LSLHSNYVDFNPASLNPYARKAALDQLRDEIELCERYSIPILTIHPGWAKKISRRLALNHLWRFLSEIFNSHHSTGTMLCLENMDHRREKLCNNAEEIALTLEHFPQLMLTVDFAHLGLTGMDIPTFLDRFDKRIAHLHLSGVIRGKRHAEIPLSASELDFKFHLERYRDREIVAVIENQSWELMMASRKILENFRR